MDDTDDRVPDALLRAADELNIMLHEDPVAIDWLLKFHVKCNTDGLVNHPKAQVFKQKDSTIEGGYYHTIGMLGILNGILCEPPFYLVAILDSESVVDHFKIMRIE